MIAVPPGDLSAPAIVVHENFHQWWGDNVSEGNFDMAFFKEGMATLATQLYEAGKAAQRAGGPSRGLGSGSSRFGRGRAASLAASHRPTV